MQKVKTVSKIRGGQKGLVLQIMLSCRRETNLELKVPFYEGKGGGAWRGTTTIIYIRYYVQSLTV